MKALVNHFGKKVEASYEGDSGYVMLPFGRCEIRASNDLLSFSLDGENERAIKQLQFMVDKHLTRFSKESISPLSWSLAVS